MRFAAASSDVHMRFAASSDAGAVALTNMWEGMHHALKPDDVYQIGEQILNAAGWKPPLKHSTWSCGSLRAGRGHYRSRLLEIGVLPLVKRTRKQGSATVIAQEHHTGSRERECHGLH